MSDAHSGGALGGGMFGKASQSYDVYLNLTPLMDVMSNILFFLMASFGASAVAVFSVTVPVEATSDAPSDAPPEDKTSLTMRADAGGITLGCTNAAKTPEELQNCVHKIPMRGGHYDTAALSLALRDIKGKYAAATSVVFVPDDDIHYETLVKILDATRDFKTPDGKRLPLFPEVVMSSLVQ